MGVILILAWELLKPTITMFVESENSSAIETFNNPDFQFLNNDLVNTNEIL